MAAAVFNGKIESEKLFDLVSEIQFHNLIVMLNNFIQQNLNQIIERSDYCNVLNKPL